MLVEQRCEGLDSNIRFHAERGGGSNATGCCRPGLDDRAARYARSERGRGRSRGRVVALIVTDGAFAILEPHWRSLVERKDGAVRSENISTYKKDKREALHNEK